MFQAEYAPLAEPTPAAEPGHGPLAVGGECDRRREPVRILVYGSPQAVRHTLDLLHLLRFVERFRWTPIRPVPENGIYISAAEAQTYAFLLKELVLES